MMEAFRPVVVAHAATISHRLVLERSEGVGENVVGYAPALGDAFGLVEAPVYCSP